MFSLVFILVVTLSCTFASAPAVAKSDIIGPSGSIHVEQSHSTLSSTAPLVYAQGYAYNAPSVLKSDIIGPSGSIHVEQPISNAPAVSRSDVVGPSGSIHVEQPLTGQALPVAVPSISAIAPAVISTYQAPAVSRSDVTGPSGSIHVTQPLIGQSLPALVPAVSAFTPYPPAPALVSTYGVPAISRSDVVGPSGSIHAEHIFAEQALPVAVKALPTTVPYPPKHTITYGLPGVAKAGVFGPFSSIYAEKIQDIGILKTPHVVTPSIISTLVAPAPVAPTSFYAYGLPPVSRSNIVGPSGSILVEEPIQRADIAVAPAPVPAPVYGPPVVADTYKYDCPYPYYGYASYYRTPFAYRF